MSKQYSERRQQARSRNFLQTTVGILAVLGIAAIWVDSLVLNNPGQETPPREPSAQASPTSDPSGSPTSDVATPQIGETRVGENADTTLLQVRKLQPPPDRAPPVGEEWFGIRAQTCMHTDASPSGGLPWSSWAVEDDLGQEYVGRTAPWDDYPAQQFPTTGIEPGACNLGWVLVAVPKGTSRSLVKVIFRAAEPPAEWAI